MDRQTIELCANETSFGVDWTASSPGPLTLAGCPKRYDGQSQRLCEQRDVGKPVWLTPDFSGCLSDTLVDVHNEVSFCRTRARFAICCQKQFVSKSFSAETGVFFFMFNQIDQIQYYSWKGFFLCPFGIDVKYTFSIIIIFRRKSSFVT